MTREDIERLLHCARHEAQGAGPATLAEVCEWGLERAATCDLIANEMRKRCDAAEAKLERAREALRKAVRWCHGGHGGFPQKQCDLCKPMLAALADEEPKP